MNKLLYVKRLFCRKMTLKELMQLSWSVIDKFTKSVFKFINSHFALAFRYLKINLDLNLLWN